MEGAAMIEYPDATKCPNCGRLETTTVCSVCKTDKAEKAVYSYEAQRYIENLRPSATTLKGKP